MRGWEWGDNEVVLAAWPLAFPFAADGDVGAPGARSPIHDLRRID